MKPSAEVPSGDPVENTPDDQPHSEIRKIFTPIRMIVAAYLALGAAGTGVLAYTSHAHHQETERELVMLISKAELMGQDEVAKNLRALASKEGFEIDPRNILEIPID